jgi:hypothetical protein
MHLIFFRSGLQALVAITQKNVKGHAPLLASRAALHIRLVA